MTLATGAMPWVMRGLRVATLAGACLLAPTATVRQPEATVATAPRQTELHCTLSAPFRGEEARFPATGRHTYMMVSAWRLAPYAKPYLFNTLADLGRIRAAGIVYATVGELEHFLRRRKRLNDFDEIAYNRSVFRMARRLETPVWLQLRLYANRVHLPGAAERVNLTAERILKDRPARRAFLRRLMREFSAYDAQFRDSCTVIVFEEAGIYHSVQGGGRFWSSRERRVRRSRRMDALFAARMARVFRLVASRIRRRNPACRVGMHLGHSVFLDRPLLARWIDWLRQKGQAPDFIFYDFYLKAQPDYENYARKLTKRVRFVKEDLRLPLYHLAQLHTMNAFQHGGGRTPSRAEIDAIVTLDERLGVDGIGFYTKNALPTRDFSNRPFAPNRRGQRTLYESARDRWDYGLQKLAEQGGIDYAGHFDLVLRGAGRPGAWRVDVADVATGGWRPLGLFPSRAPAEGGGLLAFRLLEAARFLENGRTLRLRFVPLARARTAGLPAVHLLPSRPGDKFLTAVAISRLLSKGKGLPALSCVQREEGGGSSR